MNPAPENNDWLDDVEGRRLTAEERSALRRELTGWPRELARLDEELALNGLLDSRPVPHAASNFTARVMAEIASETARAERSRADRWSWFRLPRLVFAATVALVVTVGWSQLRRQHRTELAASVSEVSLAAAVPGVEVLRDFEAIRSFRTAAQPGDVALLAALTE
jgi:hypothetical protein